MEEDLTYRFDGILIFRNYGYRYSALTSGIEHNPRPTTGALLPVHNHTRMSSSPGPPIQATWEPPPNMIPISTDSDEIVQYPQFMLLGDSITQFSTLTLQAYLQTLYIRRMDIINRGFSGFTAPMGLKALKKVLPQISTHSNSPDIKLVTVFFGANDACIPGEAQHVKLRRYIQAIGKIIEYPGFRKGDSRAEIIVITPPPVNEHQLSSLPSGDFQRRAGRTAQYAKAACDEFQKVRGIQVLDLWSIMMRKVGWNEDMGRECCYEHLLRSSEMQSFSQKNIRHIPGCHHSSSVFPGAQYQLSDLLCDGLHLTKLGYDILFEALISLIRKNMPHCAPENMSFILPEWRDALCWDEGSDTD